MTAPLSLIQNCEGFYFQGAHDLSVAVVGPAYGQGSARFLEGEIEEAILGDAFLDLGLVVEVVNAQHCSISLAVLQCCEEVELVAEFAGSIFWEIGENEISCSEESGRSGRQRRRDVCL